MRITIEIEETSRSEAGRNMTVTVPESVAAQFSATSAIETHDAGAAPAIAATPPAEAAELTLPVPSAAQPGDISAGAAPTFAVT